MKTIIKTIQWQIKKNNLRETLTNYCKLEFKSWEVDTQVANMMRSAENAFFNS